MTHARDSLVLAHQNEIASGFSPLKNVQNTKRKWLELTYMRMNRWAILVGARDDNM
jgi:hypothetical protein